MIATKRTLVLVVLAACASSSPPPTQPVAKQDPPSAPTPAPATSQPPAAEPSPPASTPGPEVASGDPNAKGELDKETIRSHVKGNIEKIRLCYERGLLKKPGLAGTLKVQFVIGRDGKVVSANPSGLGDFDVENCVAAVIQAIEFPKPKGGGTVQVNYPFTFRPPQ